MRASTGRRLIRRRTCRRRPNEPSRDCSRDQSALQGRPAPAPPSERRPRGAFDGSQGRGQLRPTLCRHAPAASGFTEPHSANTACPTSRFSACQHPLPPRVPSRHRLAPAQPRISNTLSNVVPMLRRTGRGPEVAEILRIGVPARTPEDQIHGRVPQSWPPSRGHGRGRRRVAGTVELLHDQVSAPTGCPNLPGRPLRRRCGRDPAAGRRAPLPLGLLATRSRRRCSHVHRLRQPGCMEQSSGTGQPSEPATDPETVPWQEDRTIEAPPLVRQVLPQQPGRTVTAGRPRKPRRPRRARDACSSRVRTRR